ncbi:hypothetical protein GYM62_10385 [Algoriphagus sp. NBT04N3]|jgi:hypothetical protein|uniref:hypothetical protein n=1 Tax=Algoriphagus sp. NBT04N3 TaxID=2705473 RepID=UPI001C62EAF3|nr:hypothetical protein [Algoriphagus sp. NBT04N3]QYH39180.1 hypothetical protein GYM62_10385 [Algoriphagus sp. NBT04N3]
MAKQTGVITLEGRVGRLSFYKTKDGYLAREKGGVSKSRILNDPRFARTRENMREFADNAKSSKLMRDALRPVISQIGDKRLNQRLTQSLMRVLKSDQFNVRGDRRVKDGDWDLLKDLELNAGSSLSSTLFFELQFNETGTSWEVQLPAFVPRDMIAVPNGATHYKISATGVGVDFDLNSRTLSGDSSPVQSVLDPALAQTLSVDKSQLDGSHFAYLISVEFIQIVNGVEYAINNGAHNAAKIISLSKAS